MAEQTVSESKVQQEEFQKNVSDPISQSPPQAEFERDLIEGRDKNEGEVASWFYNSEWPLLLAKIPNKGIFILLRSWIYVPNTPPLVFE
jgi:hypothetical protein